MKRVIIHSGGGVKGYLTLQTLVKIEAMNGPLYRYYDLGVASSVGAIILAILATGKLSAKQLNEIFPEMITKIFKKVPFYKTLFIKPIYDRQNFIDVWNSLIGKDFKMKDCKFKLIISAVNLMTQRNHFFKSWEDKDGEENLLDVVLRSFAAPLYFGKLIDVKNNAIWLDGGVGNSNLPLDTASIEAIDLLKWHDFYLQFDAFGCGFSNNDISFKEASKFQNLKQILSYLDFNDGGLARAQSRHEQVMKMKIKAENNNYIGFDYYDIEIPTKINKLDGVKFLEDYKHYGELMFNQPLIRIKPRK